MAARRGGSLPVPGSTITKAPNDELTAPNKLWVILSSIGPLSARRTTVTFPPLPPPPGAPPQPQTSDPEEPQDGFFIPVEHWKEHNPCVELATNRGETARQKLPIIATAAANRFTPPAHQVRSGNYEIRLFTENQNLVSKYVGKVYINTPGIERPLD